MKIFCAICGNIPEAAEFTIMDGKLVCRNCYTNIKQEMIYSDDISNTLLNIY